MVYIVLHNIVKIKIYADMSMEWKCNVNDDAIKSWAQHKLARNIISALKYREI